MTQLRQAVGISLPKLPQNAQTVPSYKLFANFRFTAENSGGYELSQASKKRTSSGPNRVSRRSRVRLNRPGFHAAVLLAASSADGPVLPA